MKPHLLIASSLTLLLPAAGAQQPDGLKVSGFGTLGLAHSSDKEADYRQNLEQGTGPGKSNKIDPGLESVFGVQAEASWRQDLQATVQVVSRRQAVTQGKPYFEWANLRYRLLPNLDLRGGRIVAPMFMLSDSRMIGYSQLTVRPPGEVYLLNPITYLNGADVGYRFQPGEVLYRLGAGGGKVRQVLNSTSGQFLYRYRMRFANASAEYRDSTLRFGYARANLVATADILGQYRQALQQLVDQGNTPAAELLRQINHTNTPIDFYSLGYSYDGHPWQIQLEYAQRRWHKTLLGTDLNGVSLLAGYHIGKFTPYVFYAHLAHKSSIQLPDVDVSPLPAREQAVVGAINNNALTRFTRSSLGIGNRWDLAENLAIKLQLEHIHKPGGNNPAYFAPPVSPEFANGRRRINLYSATLDFVF